LYGKNVPFAVVGQKFSDWQYIRPPSNIDVNPVFNWRTQKEVAKAGYFEDIASHGLDMMCFFLGNIKQAQGVASNPQGLYTAYDALAASMLFENGVTGNGHWNFAASSTADKVLIIGERGQISFSIFEDSPAVLTMADKCISQAMPKPTPIQGDFVQAMADNLRDKPVDPSMAESGAHTNWVMDAKLKDF
tara:strand:+ start:1154 stop:1723 length:570 start_codon:yes stop_codon:yes gene_type:complete